jgi:hypothetical protein
LKLAVWRIGDGPSSPSKAQKLQRAGQEFGDAAAMGMSPSMICWR